MSIQHLYQKIQLFLKKMTKPTPKLAKIFALLSITSLIVIILLIQLPFLFQPFGPSSQGDTALWLLVGYNHFSDLGQIGWLGDPSGITNQPPVMGWLIFLFFKTFGVYDYSARIFSLVFSITSCVLLFAILHKRFGNTIAFLSTMLFVSHPLTLHVQLANVLMETPMIAFVLASWFCITYIKSSLGKHICASLFFGLALLTKFTAVYFLPIFLLGSQNKLSLRQLIYYATFSLALIGTVFLFQSQTILFLPDQRINIVKVFELSYWNQIWSVVNIFSLTSLFAIVLLGLFLRESRGMKPIILTVLAIFSANFLIFTESGTWEHHLFLFLMPLSVLGGKYVYSALSHVWKSLNRRGLSLKSCVALLILLLFTLNLVATVNTDTNEIVGSYDRDLYERVAIFVSQNVQEGDIVILSGYYHTSSFIEFYLKSDLNLPNIRLISFRNNSDIEKLLESSLNVTIYAVLHEEEDFAWNPNLYNQISTNFQILTTFTDNYSEENTINVYQLLEK
jgi:hypothetical protein